MSAVIYRTKKHQTIYGKLALAGLLVMVHGLLVLRAQMPVSVSQMESAGKQAFSASATAWHAEHQTTMTR